MKGMETIMGAYFEVIELFLSHSCVGRIDCMESTVHALLPNDSHASFTFGTFFDSLSLGSI